MKKRLGAGDAPSVVEKYGPQSIRNILEQSIQPLATAWEAKLEAFDTLFYSRSVFISLDGSVFTGDDLGTLFKDQVTRYLDPHFHRDRVINTLMLRCKPVGMIQLKKEVGLDGGEINVWFKNHTYEMSYSGSNTPISKLYDETLTSEEIANIADRLGEWLLSNIEALVNDLKR